MTYTIKVIENNGNKSSFEYDDFEDACRWAATASRELEGADALVSGNGMILFMYRNGVRCDLGGTPRKAA